MNSRSRDDIWQEKLLLAQEAADNLGCLPFVKGVALTGSVAFGDVHENDDLDFLIIAQKNRVYCARFFCYLSAWVKRKKRSSKNEKNTWCMNLFLDQETLIIPKSKRSLFAITQLERLKVLYQKDEVFDSLIKENEFWIKNLNSGEKEKNKTVINRKCFCDYLETLMRMLQIRYMKGKITREIVNEKQIFFHPKKREERL